MHGVQDIDLSSTRPTDGSNPTTAESAPSERPPLPVRPPRRADAEQESEGLFGPRDDVPEVRTTLTSTPIFPAPIEGADTDDLVADDDEASSVSLMEEELPVYALDLDRSDVAPTRSVRFRQVALVALMALTAGLIVVLPEPAEDTVAVESADVDVSATPDPALALGRVDGEAAVEPAEPVDVTPLAAAPEVPAVPAADTAAEIAAALAAGIQVTTTTAAPIETTEAPTTTTTPTTAAPETTAVPDTAAPTAPEQPATAADTATDTDTSDDTESTAPESVDTTDAPADDAEAAPSIDTAETPAEPEAAPEPETTTTVAPPTTEAPANADWVDTGNGVLVPPVLIAIRFCESTHNYTAANPHSSARGAYQFLTGSWAAYGHDDRYGVTQAHLATPAQQDEAALITWQRDGTRPWNASRACWSTRI